MRLHVRADLHTHTQASDGDLSPEQITSLAKYSGLEAIAITDHDTLSGAKDALSLSKKYDIRIITGVEISVAYDPGTLHILGYFPSYVDEFNRILKRLQDARVVRLPKIIEKLHELGMDVTESEVAKIARGGQIGRPHIAKVLVGKGYVGTFDEAFSRYLGKGKPAYAEKDRMNSREAMEAILGFGGLPVLAHPFTLGLSLQDQHSFIEELAAQGLRGIEIFYPDHTKAQRKFYKDIAEEFHLLATGGTDYHGTDHRENILGSFGLDKKGYALFLEALHTTSA